MNREEREESLYGTGEMCELSGAVFQLMLICSLYLFLRSHIVVTDEGPLPFSSVT